LFKKAWAERYKGIVEYYPSHKVVDVDAASGTLKFKFNDDVKTAVFNDTPDTCAGEVAVRTGLTISNRRWCEVNF